MFQNTNVGVPGGGKPIPNYLSSLPTMQQQNQSSADRARLAMAGGMGMGNMMDQTGRLDWGKVTGAAKKFCV